MRRRSVQQINSLKTPIAPPVKPIKKKGVKREIDGHKFSSKEGARYAELKQMMKTGEISDLQIKPRYELMVNERLICRYFADFSYKHGVEPINLVVEDVKNRKSGGSFDIFRIKAKLLKAIHGIDVVVI